MPASRMKGTRIAAVLAGFVFTAAALGCGGPAARGASNGESAGVRAVAPELPGLLAPFRKQKTAADEIPGDELATLEQLGDNVRPGERPDLSRRLELANGEYAFVWPEANGICKAWDTSTGCAPTSLLAERGVLVAFQQRRDSPNDDIPDVSLFALARDGVDELELLLAGGRTLTRRFQENGALIRLSEVPLQARWRNVDGSDGSQIVMPPGP